MVNELFPASLSLAAMLLRVEARHLPGLPRDDADVVHRGFNGYIFHAQQEIRW